MFDSSWVTGKEGSSSSPWGCWSMNESELASEMNELSLQEREKIYEEIHGAADIPHENPEDIADLLTKMRLELSKSPRMHRKLWERYDPTKAAQRLCKYFHYKNELFGDDALVRRIRLDDMSAEDMEVFKTACFNIVPQRDSVGRLVWFFDQRRMDYKNTINLLRYVWYQIINSVLDDENAQLKGIVDIVYCVGMAKVGPGYASLLKKGSDIIMNALPFRLAALHYCYGNASIRPAMNLMQIAVGKATRLRFRTHFGSNMEVRYTLLTFGIPTKALPISDEGVFDTGIHGKYVDKMRKREAQGLGPLSRWIPDASDVSEQANNLKNKTFYPTSRDVLLGRGKPYQEYGGNRLLTSLVSQHRLRYQECTDRLDKIFIAMEVVKEIQTLGGHFLQRCSQGWEIVSDKAARDKVSHSFRTSNTAARRSRSPTRSTSLGTISMRTNRVDVVASGSSSISEQNPSSLDSTAANMRIASSSSSSSSPSPLKRPRYGDGNLQSRVEDHHDT